MTKRVRRAVLYFLIILFLVIGTGAIFYAQGWRTGLSPLAVEKVGGIYIRVAPNDAEVTLDGKPVRRFSRIFERGTLINSLFPGSYDIRIAKEGYQDWKATVPVAPSYVTSHTFIALVPNGSETATSTPISAIVPVGPDNFALVTASRQIFFHNLPLPGDAIVAGSEDGRVLITKTAKTGTFYLADQNAATSTNIARAFPRIVSYLKDPSVAISFIPQNDDLFLIHTSSSLRLANTTTGRTTLLAEGSLDSGAWAANASRIAWTAFDPLNERSTFSLYDILSNTLLNNVDLAPGATKKIALFGRNAAILLQDDGTLYSLSLNQNTRLKVADGVLDFSVAPDESVIALREKEGIEIVAEDGSGRYAFLRIPGADAVSRMAWYNDKDHHLFLQYSGRIAFLDLADATLENFATITPASSFVYLPGPNQLYALSSTTLLRFQFP